MFKTVKKISTLSFCFVCVFVSLFHSFIYSALHVFTHAFISAPEPNLRFRQPSVIYSSIVFFTNVQNNKKKIHFPLLLRSRICLYLLSHSILSFIHLFTHSLIRSFPLVNPIYGFTNPP